MTESKRSLAGNGPHVTEGNRSIAAEGHRNSVARGNPSGVSRAIALALVATAACASDVDPPWQLDHDRIIAVRAEPPSIGPGQTSTIEALLGHKGGQTSVAPPELAVVISPMSLSDVLTIEGGRWVVTAPSEARLASARSELKLEANVPVPLQLTVSYAGQTLIATKIIDLGRAADNPPLNDLMIDDKPAGNGELVVRKLVNVPLSVTADDTAFDVTWLTSCGTMHDFDLPNAYLHVEADDVDAGELAVIVRDANRGVSWKLWSIRAE